MSIKKEKKEKQTGAIKKSFTSQQFKSGAYSSFITILVIAVVVVINLVFTKLDLSTDLSSGSLFTLSKETNKIIKGTEDKITIYYMVQKGNEQEYIERVINQYKKVADNIKVVKKDPVTYPGFAEKYVKDTVYDNDAIVVNETTGAAKYVSNEDMYYQTSDYYSSSTQNYLDVEGRVTSAIQYVLSDDNTKLYTVSGHGETELGDSLKISLEKMNVDIEELPLMTEGKIPSDCDVLLLNGPTKDLRDEEKDKVLDYLKSGGDAVILAQYSEENDTPNMEEILKYYGLGIQKGVISEGAGHYVNYTNWIIPSADSGSDMFSDLGENEYILMANAQGITREDSSSLRSTVAITDLLTTSKQSILKVNPSSGVAEKEKGDLDGPFTTGVYVEETLDDEEQTKLTVYSTAAVDDVLIQNAVGNMIGEVENSIDAKNLSYSTVYMGIGTQVFWALLVIIIIPAGLLIAGFAIWFIRRRK